VNHIPFDLLMNHIGYSSKQLSLNPNLNYSLDKQTFEYSSVPMAYGMERELNLTLFIQILNEMISKYHSKSEIIPIVEKTFFIDRTVIFDSFLNPDYKHSKGFKSKILIIQIF
jgi:hypothetical protein